MSANKRRKLTTEERTYIYNLFNGHCAYCGCELSYEDMTVDHVKPLNRRNGTDTIDNMFPACFKCNHDKHNFTLEKYRRMLSEQRILFYFELCKTIGS